MHNLLRYGLICMVLLMGTNSIGQAQPSPAPRVWSIAADESHRTEYSTSFRVTFSEPVTGVDMADFRVFGSETAHIRDVQPTDTANVFVLTVSHENTSAEIVVMLVDDDTVVNEAGIPLGTAGAQNGNVTSIVTALSGPATVANRPATSPSASPRTPSRVYGTASSLKLTSAGTAVIAYNDETNADLKLAICDTVFCRYPTITTIATTYLLAATVSMSLTATDIPVIAYNEYSVDDAIYNLKIAVCNDKACSNPVISTVDRTTGGVGFVALALNSADVPVVSYHDYYYGSLKLAVCNNTTCTSPNLIVLDSSGYAGQYSSIAMTSADIPIISYYDALDGNLMLASCADTTCSTKTLSTIASTSNVGRYTSLALTASNIPVISFFDDDASDLKLAVCNSTTCTSPVISTLDSTGMVGFFTNMVLNSAEAPVIIYKDLTTDSLKIAQCNDTACASPAITVLAGGDVGISPGAVALDSEDRPIVSYGEYLTGHFKYILGPVYIDKGQPNSFGKSAPGNTTAITTSSVVLGWNASVGASSYEYCIALSKATCTTWNSTGTATVKTVTDLANGATYYWQVRARNDVGVTPSDNNVFWQFTVTLPPAAFAKSAPANNATKQKTSITLSWAASSYATSYEYCIALTTATCTTWKSTGAVRTAAVTGLTKNKAYYWQVRAKNLGGTTLASSTYWKFTTAP